MRTARTPAALRLGRSLPPLRIVNQFDLPCFELTFIAHGRTFKALARGRNTQAAAYEGMIALAAEIPDFDPDAARLVGAVQTR